MAARMGFLSGIMAARSKTGLGEENDINVYRVHGLRLASELALDLAPAPSGMPPDLGIEVAASPPGDVDPDDRLPLFEEGWRADGRPAIQFYDYPDRAVIRATAVTDIHVFDERIVCIPDEQHRDNPLPPHLRDLALSLWLERRGIPTLRGGAAAVDAAAGVIIARPGEGITSLLVALAVAGHDLLADGLVALAFQGPRVMVPAGSGTLHLDPSLLPVLGIRDPAADARDETTVMLRFEDLGRARTEPVPLRRVYLLEHSEGETTTRTSAMSERETIMALIRHSYLAAEVVRYGLQPERMRMFAALLSTVRGVRLTVPYGVEHLVHAASAVEADLRAASAPD